MSVPGWYPDPEGRPNLIRYWDGQRWGQVAQSPTAPSRKPNLALIALVGLVGAIIIGVAAWLITGPLGSRPEPSPTPIPAQSDGPLNLDPPSVAPSAIPTTTPTFAPPSATVPPSAAPSLNPWEACPVLVNAHSVDNIDPTATTLSSAALTFTVPAGWRPSEVTMSRLLLEQASALTYIEESTWFNFITTGMMPKDLGFYSIEQAAAAVTECHVTSASFSGFTGYEIDASEPVSVDGHRGWRQRVTASSTQAPGGGAVYEAVVLDTGLPSGFSVFWAGAVLGDQAAVDGITEALGSLKVG